MRRRAEVPRYELIEHGALQRLRVLQHHLQQLPLPRDRRITRVRLRDARTLRLSGLRHALALAVPTAGARRWLLRTLPRCGRRLLPPRRASLAQLAARRGAHGCAELLDLDSDPPGDRAHVLGPQRLVTDAGDDGGHRAHGGDAPLRVVEVEPRDRRAHGELEHRHRVFDETAHRLIALAQAQVARVHPVLRDGDERLARPALILVERLHRRLLAGGVTVEREDDARGGAPGLVTHDATQRLDVIHAERRATRRDGIVDAREVRGHDVGVALDDDSASLARDRLLREVQPVQDVGLLVDRRLARVEVLRLDAVVFEDAARAEADGVARDVADRPDDAATEPVVEAPRRLTDEPGSRHLLGAETLGAQVRRQRVAGAWREADAEVLRGLAVETLGAQEIPPGAGRRVAKQRLGVELLRHAVRLDEPHAPPRRLTVGPLALLVTQHHPGLRGEALDGLGERQVLGLHDERDDVTRLTAPETVIDTDGGTHGEARRLLVVERAQPLERTGARAPQRHVLGDDVLDVDAILHGSDVLCLDQPRHVTPSHLTRCPATAGSARTVSVGAATDNPIRSSRRGVRRLRERSPVRQRRDLVDDDAEHAGIVGRGARVVEKRYVHALGISDETGDE